jgi:hypothetical protein
VILFSEKGFIADDVLQTGTLHQALGQSTAGLSPELDALTFVKSSRAMRARSSRCRCYRHR